MKAHKSESFPGSLRVDFASRLPRMLELLRELVEMESPSHDKSAVDRLGTRIAEKCLHLGAAIQAVPNRQTGDHLIARWKTGTASAAGQKGGILLLHHMDTVFPVGTLAKMPFCRKGERICGPGVLDMKGGIVVTLEAIAGLLESGTLSRPITAVFTSDEEIGSPTSRMLIESLAKEAALVLVLEPGLEDGSLKTWRKGIGAFCIRVKGRAAHAGGEHEKGRNAIQELAHQVLTVQGWTDYTRGTTVNVGVITGGTVSNVVPAEAEARGDLRFLSPEEADRIVAALHGLKPAFPDTLLEVTAEVNRPPMPFDKTMKATFEKARRIAAKIPGMALKAGGSGGGSDANFVARLGVPVLDGLGVVGADYHSEREWSYTNSLPERAALVSALIEDW